MTVGSINAERSFEIFLKEQVSLLVVYYPCDNFYDKPRNVPLTIVYTLFFIAQKRTHNNINRRILFYKQTEVLKEYQGIFPVMISSIDCAGKIPVQMEYSLNNCRLIKQKMRTKSIEQISNRSERYPKICANSSLH